MSSLDQGSRRFKVLGHRRVVPVGKIGNEVEQSITEGVLMGLVVWIEDIVSFSQHFPPAECLSGASIHEPACSPHLAGKFGNYLASSCSKCRRAHVDLQ